MIRIFEYRCNKCNEVTECNKHYSVIVCKNCNTLTAKKILSQPSIFFKGDGWTQTPNDPTEKDITRFKDANHLEE